jgi:hypothetical protein
MPCTEKRRLPLARQRARVSRVPRMTGFALVRESEGISHRRCRLIQRNDGYGYHYSRVTISDPVVSAKNPKCTGATIRRSTSPA